MSDPFLIQPISENSKKENRLGSFFSYVEISAFPKNFASFKFHLYNKNFSCDSVWGVVYRKKKSLLFTAFPLHATHTPLHHPRDKDSFQTLKEI